MACAVLRDREANDLRCSLVIEVEPARVYREWTRYEQLPWKLEGVRRVKRISDSRILWDADVFGRQVVWEAEVIESVPGERIRWVSRQGASHAGQIELEELPGRSTRLTVEIRYRPQGVLEWLGASLGLLDLRIERDLVRFARAVEIATARPAEAPAALPRQSARR